MGREAQILSRALPPLTLSVAAACLLAGAFPGWSALLVYERQAVLAGELWRLWTGSLVHFSPGHLVYNLLAFVVAGRILEKRSAPAFGLFCFAAAGLAGAAILFYEPEMHTFGGLSGVAVGAVVYLAVIGIREGGTRRTLGWAILLAAVAKLTAEALVGVPLFATFSQTPFVPALLAHGMGVTVGLLFGITRRKNRPSSAVPLRGDSGIDVSASPRRKNHLVKDFGPFF